jgi:hypothetical protein
MKKSLSLVMVFILSIALLFPIQANAATVKINKKQATLEVDSILQLKISGTSSKVTWKSSKSTIASVSSGKVTAKKAGLTTITATVGSKKYSCVITVVNTNKSEVTAKKGTITELSSGKYVIGVDFPSGKYNLETVSGSGNVFADGDDTYLNEVFAEKGDVYFDTYTYKNLYLNYGDILTISSGVVIEFTKLN